MKNDRSNKPPAWVGKMLRWFGGASAIEDLEGDLEELYLKDLRHLSRRRARYRYIAGTISVIVSYAMRKRRNVSLRKNTSLPLLHPAMLGFYCKSAWKHIYKSPVYSFINVLGLTLGVSACLTIYLIARHEFSFDKFHPDQDRIYRIVVEANGPAGKWLGNTVPQPLPAVLSETVPGLESVTSINRYEPGVTLFEKDGAIRKFPRGSTKAALTDVQYFEILPSEWIAGSPSAMAKPFNAVLTESRARTYFPDLAPGDVVGKILTYDDSLQVTIAGIIKDLRDNSEFSYSDLISRETVNHSFLKAIVKPDDWIAYYHSFQSLVKIHRDTPIDSLEKKFSAALAANTPPHPKVSIEVQLQRLADVHFDKREDAMTEAEKNLYRLIALGVFILAIACINFINLATALSSRRVKEVGIRKTVGGSRGNVTLQLLLETALLTSLSAVVACALVRPIFSLFADFIPAGISLRLFSPEMGLFLFGLVIVTAMVAGYYPARVLSSYAPATAVRKSTGPATGSMGWLRKGLIVVQFACSICFIAGVIVMKSQLQFIENKDRGFATAGVRMFWTNFDDMSNRPRLLAERIRQIPGIEQVSVHGGSPMGFATFINRAALSENKDNSIDVVFKSGDVNYIPLYGLRLKAGRNIQDSDSLKEFVINETLAHAFGFNNSQDAIGHSLNYLGKDYPVVGIVSDFHQQSFHGPITPVAIGNIREVQHGIALTLAENDDVSGAASVLSNVEKAFKDLYPDDTFQPHFVEEEIGWMHKEDKQLAKLINVAMATTVFISALGVFGLVMFTSQVKVKEIAIRKVLGASVAGVAALLGMEFAVLLAIASVLAIPVAWYSLDKWLMTFNYHVDIQLSMFLAATALAFVVGLITVSYHTLKSAFASPARSLRSE